SFQWSVLSLRKGGRKRKGGEILRLARHGGLPQDGHPLPDAQLKVRRLRNGKREELTQSSLRTRRTQRKRNRRREGNGSPQRAQREREPRKRRRGRGVAQTWDGSIGAGGRCRGGGCGALLRVFS